MSSGKRAFVIEFKFNSSSRFVPRANDNFRLETFLLLLNNLTKKI